MTTSNKVRHMLRNKKTTVLVAILAALIILTYYNTREFDELLSNINDSTGTPDSIIGDPLLKETTTPNKQIIPPESEWSKSVSKDICKENFKSNTESSDIVNLLWHGDVPPQPLTVLPPQQDPKSSYGKISLVVSHCNENIDWIFKEYTQGYSLQEITIYSKCGNALDMTSVPSHAKVIVLPNVGRCDHTYAYHMARIHEYESALDDNDKIVFVKGNNWKTAGLKTLGHFFYQASMNGFSCLPVKENGTNWDTSIYHNYEMLQKFAMVGYHRVDRDSMDEFYGGFPTFKSYIDTLGLDPYLSKPFIPVCYGGQFIATKKQIMEVPQAVWSKIEKSLSRGNNIQEGHYMERAWSGLLSKRLSSSQVQILDEKMECALCEGTEFWWRCGVLGVRKQNK